MASTIVLGGGVVGAAVAFFLCDRGETDVLVLERDQLGAGTTKGGLGGIRHQFVDELDIRMSQLATAFWRNFEDRTGSRHDFEERGYLFIANTEVGVAELRLPMPLYHPIVGAVPGVAGLYIAAGFSGHGFMHAPATAQLVVEEMLDGRARTIDIGDLSLERFGAGRRTFKAAVL